MAEAHTQERCEEICFATALAITNAAENNEITDIQTTEVQ
jgi:hypothetical protein